MSESDIKESDIKVGDVFMVGIHRCTVEVVGRGSVTIKEDNGDYSEIGKTTLLLHGKKA